jgi:hypothetical protein
MKVICKGYKDCVLRFNCYHSTPHEYNKEDCSESVVYRYENCICEEKNVIIYSRKNKLKNLKNNDYEKSSKESKE